MQLIPPNNPTDRNSGETTTLPPFRTLLPPDAVASHMRVPVPPLRVREEWQRTQTQERDALPDVAVMPDVPDEALAIDDLMLLLEDRDAMTNTPQNCTATRLGKGAWCVTLCTNNQSSATGAAHWCVRSVYL